MNKILPIILAITLSFTMNTYAQTTLNVSGNPEGEWGLINYIVMFLFGVAFVYSSYSEYPKVSEDVRTVERVIGYLIIFLTLFVI